MKSNREKAEKLVEAYLNSEEGKLDKARWDEELKNFILYGKPTEHFDDKLLQEIKEFSCNITLTNTVKFDSEEERMEFNRLVKEIK